MRFSCRRRRRTCTQFPDYKKVSILENDLDDNIVTVAISGFRVSKS